MNVRADYHLLLVMTQGQSQGEGNVSSFKLPAKSGNPFLNVGHLPDISGSISMFLLSNHNRNVEMLPLISRSCQTFFEKIQCYYTGSCSTF